MQEEAGGEMPLPHTTEYGVRSTAAAKAEWSRQSRGHVFLPSARLRKRPRLVFRCKSPTFRVTAPPSILPTYLGRYLLNLVLTPSLTSPSGIEMATSHLRASAQLPNSDRGTTPPELLDTTNLSMSGKQSGNGGGSSNSSYHPYTITGSRTNSQG